METKVEFIGFLEYDFRDNLTLNTSPHGDGNCSLNSLEFFLNDFISEGKSKKIKITIEVLE